MKSLTMKAYGKINLSLDVTGKREDGYHLVRMVMQTVDLYDTVTIERTAGEEIRLFVDSGDIPAGPDNLVWRAADAACHQYGIKKGLRIHLAKRIPVAAGMAGGSADAAAVMNGLCRLSGIHPEKGELEALALPLGADIPYCLTGGTQLAEGIGEKLTVLPAAPCPPGKSVLVVKPDLFVSTKWVYEAFDGIPAGQIRHPAVDGQVRAIRQQDWDAMAASCGNVLEQQTGAAFPVIGELETFLRAHGARQAMMTGSGPAVFALYDSEQAAGDAYTALEMEPRFRSFQKFLTRFRDPD